MGATNEKQETPNAKITEKYEEKSKLENDPRYFEGSAIYNVKNNEQSEVVINQLIMFEKVQSNQWIDKIQARKNQQLINCENILPIKEFFAETNQESYCLTSFVIYIVFDYHPNTLLIEIENRAKKKQFFSEEDFSQIVKGTIQALHTYQLTNITNQCIRPQMITILQNEGRILPMVCDSSFVKAKNNFQIICGKVQEREKHVYLSPILLQGIHDKNPPPYDLYRSDVFSLGMTLLHAGNLTALDSFYNYEKGTLNVEKVKEKATQLRERYSEGLCQIIDQMLEMDDVERVDFKALIEGIEKHFADSVVQKEDDEFVMILSKSFYERRNKETPSMLIDSKNEEAMKLLQKSMIDEKKEKVSMYKQIVQTIEKSFHIDESEENHQIEDLPSQRQKKYSGNNLLPIQLDASQKKPLSRNQTKKEKSSDPVLKDSQLSKPSDTFPQQGVESEVQFNQITIQDKYFTTEVEEINEISQIRKEENTLQFEVDAELQSISNQLETDSKKEVPEKYAEHQKPQTRPEIIITSPRSPPTGKNESQANSSQNQQSSVQKNESQTQSIKRTGEKEKDYTNQSSTRQQIIDLIAKTRSQSQYFPLTDRRDKPQIYEQSDDSKFNSNDRYRPSSQHLPKNTPVFETNRSSVTKKSIVNETQSDGSKYFGEKQNNMKDGWGKLTFLNGGAYEGQWKNDKMDGIGTLFYGNGSIAYEGHWCENSFHGQGTLYNEQPKQVAFDYRDLNLINDNWVKYVGGFAQDMREGFGTIYFVNNEKFQCNFHEDLAMGSGIYFQRNGAMIKGYWRNNFLQEQL